MVGERIKNAVDREPLYRRVEKKLRKPTKRIRDAPGSTISRVAPTFQHRNFGGGTGAGAVGAAVGVILEDTVGLPFGADSDVMDVQPSQGSDGTIYVVNVNAPTKNMAEARAFIDAGTGFTSLLTDVLDVEDVNVIDTRVLRDTYQITLKIQS